MLVMRVYFPYKAVLPKNLAQVFRFSSIKKRFRIIWESESIRNTRMNIPTSILQFYSVFCRASHLDWPHNLPIEISTEILLIKSEIKCNIQSYCNLISIIINSTRLDLNYSCNFYRFSIKIRNHHWHLPKLKTKFEIKIQCKM